jgi:hypothetical protein
MASTMLYVLPIRLPPGAAMGVEVRYFDQARWLQRRTLGENSIA